MKQLGLILAHGGADGCDINEGLKESVRTKWSGDFDLNDGSI